MTYEQMIKQAQDNLRISKEERARAKQNGNYQRASKTVVIEGRRRNSYDVNVLFWENRIKELKRLDAEQKERDKERARKKKEKEAKQKADEKKKAEKEKEAKKRAERRDYSQGQDRYDDRHRSADDELGQAIEASVRAEVAAAEADILARQRTTDEVTVGRPLSGSGSDLLSGINNAGYETALKGVGKVAGCVLLPYRVCWWIVKLPFKILGSIFRIGR